MNSVEFPQRGPFQHLTVIGLGLIGGSFAMAAREQFPDLQIHGIDAQSETLRFALKHGVINMAALCLPTNDSDLRALFGHVDWPDSHLVVLGCHLSGNEAQLRQLAPMVSGKDILVTDLGSCKRTITELGEMLLPNQFIGGHPMAGKEFSGIEHATALLFAGKTYLLCPQKSAQPDTIERLQQFIATLGANIRRIDADTHDRYMAWVSHLPQLYAVLLANLLYRNEPGHLLGYHGAGLDDQLRLAASPYAMWHEVFQENRDNLRETLLSLRDLIDEALPMLAKAPKTTEGLSEPDTAGTDDWRPWFERANLIQKQFHAIRAQR